MRYIIKYFYRFVCKPFFFRQPPDKVHTAMIRFASKLQASPLLTRVVGYLFERHYPELCSRFLDGTPLQSPVGLSAGFDKNGEVAPLMKRVGFGFSEVGSVTAKACTGNPRPWFYRLPKSQSLVVHVGLANQGINKIRKRIAGYRPADLTHFPLILSVAKTNNPENISDAMAIKDYVTSLKLAYHTPHIGAYEINISCPNTYGGEPFTTPDRLDQLLRAVDAVHLKKPVLVKLPSSLPWRQQDSLLRVIVKHDIAGVTVANLLKDRSSPAIKDPLPASIQGGLSGLPTRATSDQLIRRIYKKYGRRLTIIGVGGIFSAADAYRKIRLGASYVELITGMIFNGPQLVAEINHDLVKLLRHDGFDSINQAIGVDVT